MGAVLRTFLVAAMVMAGCAGCDRAPADDGRGVGLVGQSPSEYRALERKSTKEKSTRKRRALTLPALNRSRGSGPPVPDVDTDEPARKLVDHIAGRGGSVEDMFIPFEAYRLLHPKYSKGALASIHDRKHRKFINYFNKLHRSSRYSGAIYLSFVLGPCRYLTEGDAGRYECSARIEMEKEGVRMSLPLKRVVNWGNRWYVLEP